MKRFYVRDRDYFRSLGVYSPGAIITYEIVSSGGYNNLAANLKRLTFDNIVKGIQFEEVKSYGILDFPDKKVDMTIKLEKNLLPGYYLLLFEKQHFSYGTSIIVPFPYATPLAVIKPVFTEWTYHAKGSYFNEERAFLDRLLTRLGSFGSSFSKMEAGFRKIAKALKIRGVNFPYKPFPAHRSINLNSFYVQNHRWDRTIWSKEFGAIDGIWNDEILSAFPIFALLEKNNIEFNVLTDIDLHNKNPKLADYDIIIFYGNEGITKEYYDYLAKLADDCKKRIILWGCQGFGYRQLDYNTQTNELTYVCTRGRNGMWGDKLEEREPDWGDEAKLLGFHFPEPEGADWRYLKLYRTLRVKHKNHWLIKESGIEKDGFTYSIMDLNGNMREGLTWAGGEVFKRISSDAEVIACLNDDEDIIGIGEYKNIIVFAPTYLPAYFAYQNEEHPEIEKLFLAAADRC